MRRTALIGCCVLSFLCLQAGERTFKFGNGPDYTVKIKGGKPVPQDLDELYINPSGVMRTMDPETKKPLFTWVISGEIKVPGEFTVVTKTPFLPGIEFKFKVDGPGLFTWSELNSVNHPNFWKWAKDPGEEWIPFEMSFQKPNGTEAFKVVAWGKIEGKAKPLTFR
jgi:hypothetical protein